MTDNLNVAKLQLAARLYVQALSAAQRMVVLHTEACKRVQLDHQHQFEDPDYLEMDQFGVTVHWRDSWSQDNRRGSYDLPFEALADDTYKEYVANTIDMQLTKQKVAEDKRIESDLRRKREQFEKLKAELGE